MTLSPIVALPIALAGNACLSLGMVLQKKHVAWLGARKRAESRSTPGFRRDLVIWTIGFVLMNLQPIFLYISLFGLPANVAASTAGSSVAFTALFSVPLLGERLSPRRILWTLALFSAIALAGVSGGRGDSGGGESAAASMSAIFVVFVLPLVAALLVSRAGRDFPAAGPSPTANVGVRKSGGAMRGTFAAFMGATAGALGGFMVIPMRVLQSGPGSLESWLFAPWLWLYIAAGVSAFVFSQKAYAAGGLGTVAPAFYGMQVLWPALASYLVFGTAFVPFQAVSFAAIAAAVWFMARPA